MFLFCILIIYWNSGCCCLQFPASKEFWGLSVLSWWFIWYFFKIQPFREGLYLREGLYTSPEQFIRSICKDRSSFCKSREASALPGSTQNVTSLLQQAVWEHSCSKKEAPVCLPSCSLSVPLSSHYIYMTKCPAMHHFPGLKISVGCMISLALHPLGGGHHAESMLSPCPLPGASSQWPNLGNACPECTGTTAAQHLLLSVQGGQHLPGGCSCSTPSTRAKKNPGAVGATLAEAKSDSQKSSNLSKFERSSTLGRACNCPGDHLPLTLLTVKWCKQGRGCQQPARLWTGLRACCRAKTPSRAMGATGFCSLHHTVSTCVIKQGSQELRDLPHSYPAQSRSVVWMPSHTCDEPLIRGFLSGSHGQVLPAAGTCSEDAQSLGREELRTFGGWTGLLEVELRLCLTCLCYIKWEVWVNRVHGHFLSRQPRAQARAMSQKHVCMQARNSTQTRPGTLARAAVWM